jgi:iron complex transport system permease protein
MKKHKASLIPDIKLPLFLTFGLVLVMVLSLMAGSVFIDISAFIYVVFGISGNEAINLIVWEIRLPRIVLGAAVGFSLGLSGAALQGLLRNPLADPGVLGISSGAGLGAVTAFYTGMTGLSVYMLPAFAIAGAALATLCLALIMRRETGILTLVLAGVALSSLTTACTALIINLAPDRFSLADMVLWLMGSLANRGFDDLALAIPLMLPGWICLLMAAKPLRLLSLGEETAQTLGVSLAQTQYLVIIGTALCVGAGVAVTGAIGFVGLVIPHLIRPLVAHDPAQLLLPSGLAGAMVIVIADSFVRAFPAGQELQLGVVTSLIGAPFFFYLLVTWRRRLI